MLLSPALRRLRRAPPTAELPDLSGAPLVGHARAFREDPFALLAEAVRRGPLVQVKLLERRVWVVTDPDAVAQMLDDHGD